MSSQVVDFLESVKTDEELQKALLTAMDADNDRQAVTDLATSKGYSFSPEELWAEVQKRQSELQNRQDKGELSDEELEAVAGGEVIATGTIIGITIASAALSAGITATAPPAKW